MPDPLPPDLADALESWACARGSLGNTTCYFTETASTNDVAWRLAEAGARTGTMVVASGQTAGRGRLGRQWYSPPDAGLYVSLVLRGARAAPYLTLAGGVAVAQGITGATGLPVRIKWPNDIIVPDGSRPAGHRKLAGILAEASSGAAGVSFVILGLGINLRPASYPAPVKERATSIEEELGRPVDGWAVLGHTLGALHAHLASLDRGDTRGVLDLWRARAPSAHGARVEFDSLSGRVEGLTAGIDDTGALLVHVGDRVERVIAGEVVWK